MTCVYYKVTAEPEIHHGFHYQNGLNILDKNFEPKGSCVAGGLYFTTIENVPNFYSYGCNLREVYLPIDHEDFQMVSDPDGNKFRANKIILGAKYSLFDVKTYEKFGLKINQNYYLVHMATINGRVDCLEMCKKNGFRLKVIFSAIDQASAKGYIDVLQWWLENKGSAMPYTHCAINEAAKRGNISVLRWWVGSGLELKYSDEAILSACQNGHIGVLTLFKRSKIIRSYVPYALETASESGQIEVLDWWKRSGFVTKHDLEAAHRRIYRDCKNRDFLQLWNNFRHDMLTADKFDGFTGSDSGSVNATNLGHLCTIL